MVLWQAQDLNAIQARTDGLAVATGVDSRRLLAWCTAFAGMNALELTSQGDVPHFCIETLRELALRGSVD